MQEGQVCPLCRDSLPIDGEPLAVCPRCQTLYHEGCVRELGGGSCATGGCGGGLRVRDRTESPERGDRNMPERQTSTAVETRGRVNLQDLFYGVFYLGLIVVCVIAGFDAKTTEDMLWAGFCAAMGCFFAWLFLRDAINPRAHQL